MLAHSSLKIPQGSSIKDVPCDSQVTSCGGNGVILKRADSYNQYDFNFDGSASWEPHFENEATPLFCFVR